MAKFRIMNELTASTESKTIQKVCEVLEEILQSRLTPSKQACA